MTWEDHIKNYEKLSREGGYTIAQYAEEYGLNPNTARRYLRSQKDASPTRNGVVKNKAVRGHAKKIKALIRNDQKSDQAGRDHDHANSVNNQRDGGTARGKMTHGPLITVEEAREVNDQDHEVITRAKRSMKERLARDRADRGKDFEFQAADFRIDNDEITREARAMLKRTGADHMEITLIEKTLCHLLMLETARDSCLELIDDLKREGDDTPVQHRMANMLANCTAQIVNLVNTVYGIRNTYRKEVREQEKHAFTMGNAGVVKLAYQKRREHGWSDQDTAAYIEENGGKVPPFLMELVRNELKYPRESESGDEEQQTAAGAPSLEDLDRAARERAQARRVDTTLWLEQRRDDIDEIVDRGGHGDVDINGEANEAWLAQDLDEDEEEDEDVTRDLYGDDD